MKHGFVCPECDSFCWIKGVRDINGENPKAMWRCKETCVDNRWRFVTKRQPIKTRRRL